MLYLLQVYTLVIAVVFVPVASVYTLTRLFQLATAPRSKSAPAGNKSKNIDIIAAEPVH